MYTYKTLELKVNWPLKKIHITMYIIFIYSPKNGNAYFDQLHYALSTHNNNILL